MGIVNAGARLVLRRRAPGHARAPGRSAGSSSSPRAPTSSTSAPSRASPTRRAASGRARRPRASSRSSSASRPRASASRSTPGSPRWRAPPSRPGRSMLNDVSGLRDPALAELAARTGAALVLMHTRAEPKREAFPRLRRRGGRRRGLPARADRRWRARTASADEQLVLDPGPDFAKTPAQTVAVLRDLDRLHALGRPLLLAISRKYFLGRDHRAPAGRAPGRHAGRGGVGRRRGRGDPARARRRRRARRARGQGRPRRARRGARVRRRRRGAEVDPGRPLACRSLTGSPAAARNAVGLPTDTMFKEDP